MNLAAFAAISAVTLLAASPAQAQAVYRIVGPDGRVTFSDKPPVAADKATPVSAGGKSAGGGAALPFELRQVASKYPVTLYTSSDCAPCGAGRALLSSRGVPFAEKTISTAEDTQALQRLSGESSLPFLTIGSQQIKGYSDSEWTQFLNAACYPRTSTLTASYRNPAATPLVTVQKAAPAVKPEETQTQRAPAQPSSPPVDTTSNPAGIKF
ncbi:MAG: glutaredoxin family protein [Rhodoferax sp.]|nr:glutaredoxin family protein [Rhodoferax sp.]